MKLNKLMFSLLGSLALAVPAFAGTAPSAKGPAPVAPAPEESLGVTVGIGYDSHLFYHGFEFGENYLSGDITVDVPLTSAVKANVEASYGNVFDDVVFGDDYQRLVLGTGISTSLGAAELGLGYRWIHHEGDLSDLLDDGHEIGLTVATAAGPLNIGLGGYYDFADDGWYFELAVNSEIKINDRISIVPGCSIGYGIDYAANFLPAIAQDVIDDGFIAVTPSIALPIKLTDKATLTPYIAARLPIDALDDFADQDDEIYGGVSLTVSF